MIRSTQELLTYEKRILKQFPNFDMQYSTQFSDMVNFTKAKQEPIHRWFRYREGFSPSLVNHFVSSDDKWVFDPFCGSGTTLVSSLQSQKNSIGIDLNPVSIFMAQVKTKKWSSAQINKIKESIPKIFKHDDGLNLQIPKLQIIHKVFHPEILDHLLRLRHNIELVDDEIMNFLLFGWISILEKVSNTKKEGNGLKYRSTVRTKNGYIHINDDDWQKKIFGSNKIAFVNNILLNQYKIMINDVKHYGFENTKSTSRVFCDDAINMKKYLNDTKISKIIFSPPYVNSFDYFEIFKIELWMGKFIQTYEQLRNLRKNSIGSLWGTNYPNSNMNELEEILEFLDSNDLWSAKITKMILTYFAKMKLIISQLYDLLIDGGKCVIVVGNSAYGNVIIPTDLIFSKFAQNYGFENIKIHVARHLTTSSQQKKNLNPIKKYLRESVLVFEK